MQAQCKRWSVLQSICSSRFHYLQVTFDILADLSHAKASAHVPTSPRVTCFTCNCLHIGSLLQCRCKHGLSSWFLCIKPCDSSLGLRNWILTLLGQKDHSPNAPTGVCRRSSFTELCWKPSLHVNSTGQACHTSYATGCKGWLPLTRDDCE